MVNVMRRWLLACLIWGLASFAARADDFVPGVNDLPLMPGLSALPNESTVFDAPGGRVVEAWAQGAVPAESVLVFYRTTLPQLGWVDSGQQLFRREREILRLEFPSAPPSGAAPTAASGRTLYVRFYLSPGN